MMTQKEKVGFYSIGVNVLLVAIKGACPGILTSTICCDMKKNTIKQWRERVKDRTSNDCMCHFGMLFILMDRISCLYAMEKPKKIG